MYTHTKNDRINNSRLYARPGDARDYYGDAVSAYRLELAVASRERSDDSGSG